MISEIIKLIRPEFFDIFGILVFSFITSLSVWGLWTKKKFPKWATIILLTIGVLGLIVDGTIVYMTYLK